MLIRKMLVARIFKFYFKMLMIVKINKPQTAYSEFLIHNS